MVARGRRARERQGEFWVATGALPNVPQHIFYDKLNAMLAAGDFDDFVEEWCEPFYADNVGRPGIPPGVYFRMLFVGYFEGIDSQRGIAWRCADSRSLARFLGYGQNEATPDYSSLTRIRDRLPLEIHEQVFAFVLSLADCRRWNYWGLRTYIPEPDSQYERRWTDKPPQQKEAVYANRRRMSGKRGKRLQKKRSEYVERSFAHVCETGGARRTWLCGLEKINKRYNIQVAARNLGLLMRKLFGIGKPRCLQGGSVLVDLCQLSKTAIQNALSRIWNMSTPRQQKLHCIPPVATAV